MLGEPRKEQILEEPINLEEVPQSWAQTSTQGSPGKAAAAALGALQRDPEDLGTGVLAGALLA